MIKFSHGTVADFLGRPDTLAQLTLMAGGDTTDSIYRSLCKGYLSVIQTMIKIGKERQAISEQQVASITHQIKRFFRSLDFIADGEAKRGLCREMEALLEADVTDENGCTSKLANAVYKSLIESWGFAVHSKFTWNILGLLAFCEHR